MSSLAGGVWVKNGTTLFRSFCTSRAYPATVPLRIMMHLTIDTHPLGSCSALPLIPSDFDSKEVGFYATWRERELVMVV